MPKRSNSYGKGRPIVLAQYNEFYTGYRLWIKSPIKEEGVRFFSISTNKNSLDQYPGLIALAELRKDAETLQQIPDIYNRFVLNYDLFVTAHKKVSFTKGAMTKGYPDKTLDEYSSKIIKDTIQKLKNHTFKFSPVRREYIQKANGKLRVLGIASPRDRIVQQVMLMILEAIFEKKFLNTSHGFRHGKSTHTALQNVSK